MATKLQIWNRALYHLGEPQLVTLTDDVESRRVIETIWLSVLEDALSRGDWNFAMKTRLATVAAGEMPSPGYQSVFNKFSDWQRTITFAHTEFVDDSFSDDFDVLDEGQFWHTHNPVLYVRYISTDFAQDSAIQFFPTSYVQFVQYLLARDICERLTQGTGLYEKLDILMDRQLLKAKSIDARNMKQTVIRPGQWAQALGGNSSLRRSDRYNTISGVIPARKGGV